MLEPDIDIGGLGSGISFTDTVDVAMVQLDGTDIWQE